MALIVKGLTAKLVADGPATNKVILTGVDLKAEPGEVHIIMGPNGSGKSSLSKIMLAHPDYEVTGGSIELDGEDITELETTDIARKGLFLAAQYPTEVPGVNLAHFTRMAYNALRPEADKLSIFKFRQLLREKLKEAGLDESFMQRNLNEGFSGGEKKKCEILQMLLLEPKYAILDETDSGLDIDAIKIVFANLAHAIKERKQMGVIIITHYHRVFDYIKPDFVHVFKQGRIVKTGGLELAQQVDTVGYEGLEV